MYEDWSPSSRCCEEQKSPGESWCQEDKSWEQVQPSSFVSAWQWQEGLKSWRSKRNRWDRQTGREEVWRTSRPRTTWLAHIRVIHPNARRSFKGYQLWCHEGSDHKGNCCCTSVFRAEHFPATNGKVRAEFYKPKRKNAQGEGYLTKRLRKRAEQKSSTSGAKASREAFSKWKRSRRR